MLQCVSVWGVLLSFSLTSGTLFIRAALSGLFWFQTCDGRAVQGGQQTHQQAVGASGQCQSAHQVIRLKWPFLVPVELTWSGRVHIVISSLLGEQSWISPAKFEFSNILFPCGMTHNGIKGLIRLLQFANECSASQWLKAEWLIHQHFHSVKKYQHQTLKLALHTFWCKCVPHACAAVSSCHTHP